MWAAERLCDIAALSYSVWDTLCWRGNPGGQTNNALVMNSLQPTELLHGQTHSLCFLSSIALPKSNGSADNRTSALGDEPHLIAEEKASGGRVSWHVIDLIPALFSLCGALSIADCTVAQSIAARHRLGSWRWGWWILHQMTLYNNNNALREVDIMRRSTH